MELIILTDYRGALRQRQQVYESLDVDGIVQHLDDAGVTVTVATLEDAAAGRVDLDGRWIHATSTQVPRYRAFLDDVLHDAHRRGHLLPRYEIYRAHEDKGFQELEKRRCGLPGLQWRFYGNLVGLQQHPHGLSYPLVFKPAAGFMSSGVQLVRDDAELEAAVRRLNRPADLWRYRLKEWLKKHVLRGRYRPEMYQDCVHAGSFVLQEFAPGADCDWKVLVYGDRLYAVRRGVRPGDFRASGSGRLRFERPSDAVLDYARHVHATLDAPMLSLDIIEAEGGCRLVEFQGTHFGTYTQEEAPHHFMHDGDAWQQIDGRRELAQEHAHALLWYLRRHEVIT